MRGRLPALLLALLWLLPLGIVPPAIAATCAQAGGAPGPLFGGSGSGLGAIGAISPISPIGGVATLGGQAPTDFVARLLGASPEPAPLDCRARDAASSEPASLPLPSPGQAAGNPVDLVTGNKYAHAIDVVMPDPESGLEAALREALGEDAERSLGPSWQPFAPLRFVFSRHYNSRFDAAGPLGPGWRHGFETALARLRGKHGIELQIVQADGRRIVFRRSEPAKPSRDRPGGHRYLGLQDGDGQVDEDLAAPLPWVWRWPDGRTLAFDRDGRLARVEAPDRDRIVLHRDSRGLLRRLDDSAGRSIRLEHAGARLASIVLPDGARIGYDYDRHGQLAAVRYPDGRALRYLYEDPQAFHLLTGIQTPDGARSRYRYDDARRVVESQPREGSPAGAIALSWRLPDKAGADGETTVDEGGRVSRWRWRIDPGSGIGRLLSVEGEPCVRCPMLVAIQTEKGVSPQRALTFDRFGLPSQARLSGLARFSDGQAVPVAMHLRWGRHADGPLIGKLAWVERLAPDGRAARTELRHDARRMLVAVERPEGLVERFERDPLGRPTLRQRADRARLAASFDGAWRLVDWRVRDAVTTVGWGADGLPRSIAWPAGDRWSLRWAVDGATVESDRGWVARSVDAAASAPAAGPSASEGGGPAQDGRRGRQSGAGVAVALALGGPHPLVVDAAGRRTAWRHDDFGRLIEESSTAAGTRRFRHDDWGRVESVESPDGVVERRRHDLAGRLVEREQVGPGETITTRFDWRGGLLVGVDHPAQRTRVEHDELGRVVAIVDEIGGVTHRWSFERDARERVVARGLPDGSRLRHRFDPTGRPVALDFEPAGGGPALAIVDDVRHGAGHPVAWRYGNGVRFERRDDPAGRPLEWRWLGLDPLPAWRYRWRDDGLLASVADRAFERRFGWDALGRLIVQERHPVGGQGEPWRRGSRARSDGARASGAPDTEYFAWDLAGDLRFARRRDGTNWRAADHVPQRDAAGRPSRHRELELRYGPQGRIVEARRASAAGGANGEDRANAAGGARLVARYAYNAAGERVEKHADGRRTGFLYRHRALAAETGADGRLVRHYLRWNGAPVAIVDPGGGTPRITWLHGDHLGTPHAATDASGRPVWRADYEAFGRIVGERRAFPQPLRFAGQYHDEETGLHDNYLRSYDPVGARYLEPDPLGLAGGLNPWAYADGNPLMATDPLGLILFAFDGTNNGDPAPGRDDISNVRKFFQHYDGMRWYMTGVGLDDPGSGIRANALDAVNANTARARVDYMLAELDGYLGDDRIGQTVDIDVVGFSRGAAMARDFVNRVANLDAERYWWAKGFCINLRFLGLWDTVAQFGENGSQNHRWQLGIPSAVGAAYHAVALNEHRALFPLEAASGAAVVERGFIGSHADVGGGNAEGDLSDVSLAWMAKMAAGAGVRMKPLPERYLTVELPLLHDRNYDGFGDRRVDTRDASGAIVSSTAQRQAAIGGMDWAGSQPFIIASPKRERDAYGRLSIVGSVDIEAYSSWLADQYGLRVAVR